MSRKVRIVTRQPTEVVEEYEEEVNVPIRRPASRSVKPSPVKEYEEEVNDPIQRTASRSVRPSPVKEVVNNPLITFYNDVNLFSSQDLIQFGIPLLNQCVFYIETLRMNGIGIFVDNVERAELFEKSFDLSIIQEESPRQAHYLQVITQRQASENRLIYWMINTPILPISTEEPILGKIQYYLATRENKYLAIIVLSE